MGQRQRVCHKVGPPSSATWTCCLKSAQREKSQPRTWRSKGRALWAVTRVENNRRPRLRAVLRLPAEARRAEAVENPDPAKRPRSAFFEGLRGPCCTEMHYSPMNRRKRRATWPSVSVHSDRVPCHSPRSLSTASLSGSPLPGATGTATGSGKDGSHGEEPQLLNGGSLPLLLPKHPAQPAFRP